jgi:hypothetical protein
MDQGDAGWMLSGIIVGVILLWAILKREGKL